MNCQDELTETLVTVKEEYEGPSLGQKCVQQGNWQRLLIGMSMFILREFGGQSAIEMEGPMLFRELHFGPTSSFLYAGGIYAFVKAFATLGFLIVGIDQVGRRIPLATGPVFIAMFYFVIGAVTLTNPADPNSTTVAPAAIVLVVLVYCSLIPYCFSWGAIPWVYVTEMFCNSMRSYGAANSFAVQRLSAFTICLLTPTIFRHLLAGKTFILFGGINLLLAIYGWFLPETKGMTLEEMDILFGNVTPFDRQMRLQFIEDHLRGTLSLSRQTTYTDPSTTTTRRSRVSSSVRRFLKRGSATHFSDHNSPPR
jgi:hypothetical protein